MKIVKHCHEECAGNLEVAQGALLGLVVDNRLEITNCFPFPKTYDESIDEGDPCLFVYLLLKWDTTILRFSVIEYQIPAFDQLPKLLF